MVSIDNEYVTFHINKSIFKESPEELVFTLTFIEKQFHLIEKKMAGAEDSQFIIAIKKLEDQHSFINSNKVVKIPGVGFALFKYNTFLEKLFNSGLSNTKIKAVVINEKLLELEQTSKISQRFFMLELFFNRKTLLSKVTKQTWENIFVKLSRPNTIDYFAKEKLLQTASLKNSNIESKDLKDDKALRDVSNSFEAFFMNQILESSLKSSKIAGEGTGSDIIKGMYTNAVSEQSSGSLGISDMLYNFLSEKK